MKLDERRWVFGGGVTPEWRRVMRQRVEDGLRRLSAVSAEIPAKAPEAFRRKPAHSGLLYFLRRRGPERDALAAHPAFDYWLSLWDRHFKAPCPEENWLLQLGAFQALAAWLAVRSGDRLDAEGVLDPDGRLCLYGGPLSLDFGKERALTRVALRARAGGLSVSGPGGLEVSLPARLIADPPAGGLDLGGARLETAPRLRRGLIVEDRAWLITHGVTMHGLKRLEPAEKERFAKPLELAIEDLEARLPGLAAEFSDMMHVLIPLENSKTYGSVSSSYVDLRGAICLSHAEDVQLQAETLIHEFCHQKMNQLLAVEPLLVPGQAGQVFHSPWRQDARRLRGLLLGAHAFLNVAAYLMGVLRAGEKLDAERRISFMVNAAQRLQEVEDALRTLSFYASLTPFGREFLLGMWRELGLLHHAALLFPAGLLAEAREKAAGHRSLWALGDTGLHKPKDFVDKVKRAPFQTRGGTERGA